MTKKLILLILALPLLLMIILFTATDTVSRDIDVPVSSINIFGDEIVYLDLDRGETYEIEYAVYPTTAKNKEVVFSYAPVGEDEAAELSYSDGILTPLSAGISKVYLTTVDGGFKDSFIVEVSATALTDIEASAENTSLTVGQRISVTAKIYPENAHDAVLSYSSSDESVVKVSAAGLVSAVGRGEASVRVFSESNPTVYDEIAFTVKNADKLDLSASNISLKGNTGSFSLSVDTDTEYSVSHAFFDKNGIAIDGVIRAAVSELDTERGLYTFAFTFTDEAYIGDIVAKITLTDGTGSVTKECLISKVNKLEASFSHEGAFGISASQSSALTLTVTPEDAEVSISVSQNNANISYKVIGNRIIVTGIKSGVTKITAVLYDGDESATVSTFVAVKPKSLTVLENAATFGIEDIFTVGKYSSAGSVSEFYFHTSSPTEAGEGFAENLSWITSDPAVSVSADGLLSFEDSFTGTVDIKASFSYDGVTLSSSPMTVRCVGDGINVYNYKDLLTATRAERPAVLQASIKDDFGYENGNPVYTEIETTYDKTYYKNLSSDDTKVKVLIEFKNDLYGNGFVINAHNLAYGLDDTDQLRRDALFRGPKNFVAMSEGEGSAVSVKAQDNICFALYEGVKVINAELRACDLDAVGGSYDLTDLTYVGTTVEVLGDGVSIEYSRLTNGRTVLRVFGDANDPAKTVNLTVKNTVLSGAREFLLRMGSNCFVDGTEDNISPTLPGDKGSDYKTKASYNTFTDEAKAEYDESFIKTFVTLENSVFKDTGIFAVAIDAHFSGPALYDGSKLGSTLGSLIGSWKNLAKTSYGAKLTLKGDVRFYNWTDIEKVDSSSIIEIVGKSNYENMKIDVKKMVLDASEKEAFGDIIYDDLDTKYVHAGITFIGGGKNYGVVDLGSYSSHSFSVYEVSFDDIDRPELAIAAGSESFYFHVYDATTKSFLPEDQKRLLASGEAYDCIYK